MKGDFVIKIFNSKISPNPSLSKRGTKSLMGQAVSEDDRHKRFDSGQAGMTINAGMKE